MGGWILTILDCLRGTAAPQKPGSAVQQRSDWAVPVLAVPVPVTIEYNFPPRVLTRSLRSSNELWHFVRSWFMSGCLIGCLLDEDGSDQTDGILPNRAHGVLDVVEVASQLLSGVSEDTI